MATTMTATMAATVRPKVAAARYFVSPDVRHYTDPDGTAIFNTKAGAFHSLVKEGSIVWSTLAGSAGVTIEDVIDDLLAHGKFIDKPRLQTERALDRMFEQFIALGIISRSDQTPGQSNDLTRAVRSGISTVLVVVTRPIIGVLTRSGRTTLAVLLYRLLYDLTLKIAGFHRMYDSVRKWPVSRRAKLDAAGVVSLCEAIDLARLWYPKQTKCLPYSAVITCLLRCSGVTAKMVTAVQKEPFKGHAWTEVDGIVVNDKPKVQTDYNVLDGI